LNGNKFVLVEQIDNRIEALWLPVARLRKQNQTSFGLYILPIQLRSSRSVAVPKMINKTIRPNVAIVMMFVGRFYNTNDWQENWGRKNKIGKGPVTTTHLRFKNNLRELILDTAEVNKIPFQSS
jgi:putative aminopeptidase FrvX